jgi:hypothetical protein
MSGKGAAGKQSPTGQDNRRTIMAGIDKTKAAEIKAACDVKIGEKDGQAVTRGEIEFDKVRQTITTLLAAHDYPAYEEYRKVKYGDFEPTLDMRKEAYKLAFAKLLDAMYTKTLA